MKLTICGGGGFRVPLVLQALAAARDRVAIDEVVLHDVDAARLERMAGVWRGLAEPARGAGGAAASAGEGAAGVDAGAAPFTVRTTTDLADAVRGTAVVFSAIRVGGAQGRVDDERRAMAAGLLGQETVGAGGLLYAMRTVPVTDALARTVATESPDAWVINFTNPAGIITESMRQLHERVVGICDTPIGLVRRTLRAAGFDPRGFDRGEVAVDYAGLNHLGWLRGLRDAAGTDHLPRVTGSPEVTGTLEEARLVGTDWIRATGAIPNEYVYYYLHATRAREALAAAERTRGEEVRAQQEAFGAAADAALAGGDGPGAAGAVAAARAWEDALRERDDTYMATERAEQGAGARDEDGLATSGGGYHEVAIDLMSALLGDEEHRMILDVPNRAVAEGDPVAGRGGGAGAGPGGGPCGGEPIVPALDADAVVEVPVLASRHAVTPLVPRTLPTAEEQALMASLKACERLTVAAARAEGAARVDLAWRALAAHPLVGDLDAARRLAATL